jgi:hypothetical protein
MMTDTPQTPRIVVAFRSSTKTKIKSDPAKQSILLGRSVGFLPLKALSKASYPIRYWVRAPCWDLCVAGR